MNIKKRFVDEDTLNDYLHSHIDGFLSSVKGTVGHLETEYLAARKKALKGWVTIIVCFLVISIPFFILDEILVIDFGIVGGWVEFAILIGAAFMGYKAWRSIQQTLPIIKKFNAELNGFLWPLVFRMFSLEVTLEPAEVLWQAKISPQLALTSSRYDLTAVLMTSELITEKFNRSTVDDVIVTSIGDNALRFAELDIKNVTGSGKNRNVKNIFRGYFVEFDLDLELKGKTFVSTEGDKRGFGHQSFWKSFAEANAVQPTTLEWNRFEELLHVASSDPTEARYILSPSFMNDLYDWWEGRKYNIRISFIGTKMYMLFPDKDVQFGKTIDKIEKKQLLSYLEKIAPPVMHILHLVEDVQLQFNR